MTQFTKPKVIVSKCLGFAQCRYNALMISDEFVDTLRSYVEFHPVCPEVEIGLGVPRSPVRIVSVKKELRLVQPATNLDITEKMHDFAKSFLNSAKEADGFILKNRSPSCGIKDVKVYPSTSRVPPVSRSSGFFGGAVLESYPNLAVEDEGRLRNTRIREHFLTKLYTTSAFGEVRNSGSMKDLIRFHTENKLLLMAYNQKELANLGRIVANHEKADLNTVITQYELHLSRALSQTARYTSVINVLMHSLGYFSEGLSKDEKKFFLNSIEEYREGIIPLSATLFILRSWVVRFNQKYLSNQTFFEPYPEGLSRIAGPKEE